MADTLKNKAKRFNLDHGGAWGDSIATLMADFARYAVSQERERIVRELEAKGAGTVLIELAASLRSELTSKQKGKA